MDILDKEVQKECNNIEKTNLKDEELTLYDVVMKYKKKNKVIKSKKLKGNDFKKTSDESKRSNKDSSLSCFENDNKNTIFDIFTNDSNTTSDVISKDLFSVTTIESGSNQLLPYKNAYKMTKKAHWSKENISKLYELLSVYGADPFSIHASFPEFTEKQIRNRMNLEHKNNLNSYEAACNNKKSILEYQNLLNCKL